MTAETIAPGMQYSAKTLHRARRALRCSRLRFRFFQTLQHQSVPLSALSAPAGYTQGYTRRPLTELGAEQDLLWLIQVGVLRREVDGQGITDSFRLTPLGHLLVLEWAEATVQDSATVPPAAAPGIPPALPTATPIPDSWQSPPPTSRLYNALNRWLHLLF